MATFIDEREGQIDFYTTFLPRINPALTIDDVLSDSNDGVLNGNLLEFKINIRDINAALFQSIKYLSALRIKGKPVPATINIIDVNAETAWVYDATSFLKDIETVYTGAASKGTAGFVGGRFSEKLEYGKNTKDADRLIAVLKENNYTKINIDENCIVGWATTFYNMSPTARKEDFIGDDKGKHKTVGEIRNPNLLQPYIYPYTGGTNIKFSYLMDKLNDTLNKKNLGAFYTPPHTQRRVTNCFALQ